MTERHGTYLGYQNDGCRCDECLAAHRLYCRQGELDRIRGNPRNVDAAHAVAWAACLQTVWGLTPARAVADATGMTKNGAYQALNRGKWMRRDNHRALMEADLDTVGGTALMRAAPARWMVEVLCERHGWTMDRLGEVVGVSSRSLAVRGDRCQVSTYRALRDRLRAEARFGVCEDCDRLAWGGGRFCKPHLDAATDELRDARRERARMAGIASARAAA